MTSNAKIGVLWIFWRFWAARRIPRANCAEVAIDRPRRAACEIISIGRRFQRSKSRPSIFKETCAWGHKNWYPLKVVILPWLSSLPWKKVSDRHGCTYYEWWAFLVLSTSMTLKDPKLQKVRGFIFCNFRLRRALQEWISTKWLKIDWGNLRTGTAIGFCASREH